MKFPLGPLGVGEGSVSDEGGGCSHIYRVSLLTPLWVRHGGNMIQVWKHRRGRHSHCFIMNQPEQVYAWRNCGITVSGGVISWHYHFNYEQTLQGQTSGSTFCIPRTTNYVISSDELHISCSWHISVIYAIEPLNQITFWFGFSAHCQKHSPFKFIATVLF